MMSLYCLHSHSNKNTEKSVQNQPHERYAGLELVLFFVIVYWGIPNRWDKVHKGGRLAAERGGGGERIYVMS